MYSPLILIPFRSSKEKNFILLQLVRSQQGLQQVCLQDNRRIITALFIDCSYVVYLFTFHTLTNTKILNNTMKRENSKSLFMLYYFGEPKMNSRASESVYWGYYISIPVDIISTKQEFESVLCNVWHGLLLLTFPSSIKHEFISLSGQL